MLTQEGRLRFRRYKHFTFGEMGVTFRPSEGLRCPAEVALELSPALRKLGRQAGRRVVLTTIEGVLLNRRAMRRLVCRLVPVRPRLSVGRAKFKRRIGGEQRYFA